ncbi:GDYXXLXY domain-containing protein [Aquimarina aquimarini]|uniref:GDYXXLXY domain-containing protein n=1 Tax=Aquimarina aquimarini TaxID=1191734 RepID=UPI001F33B58D|nr:GDYXXLXY domain-containing protein [Aquimarina aquimarini]
MKIIYACIAFAIIAIAQIGVPLKMIYDNEDALQFGTAYKFKTQPIDPTDPFRGKYITLRYEMDSFETEDTTYVRGDNIKVYIENDDQGFAQAVAISKEEIAIKKEYVEARVQSYYNGAVQFELVFNRFYMKETKAYEAEKAYNEISREQSEDDVYALIRLKKGNAVIENVIIAGMPIQDYVELPD